MAGFCPVSVDRWAGIFAVSAELRGQQLSAGNNSKFTANTPGMWGRMDGPPHPPARTRVRKPPRNGSQVPDGRLAAATRRPSIRPSIPGGNRANVRSETRPPSLPPPSRKSKREKEGGGGGNPARGRGRPPVPGRGGREKGNKRGEEGKRGRRARTWDQCRAWGVPPLVHPSPSVLLCADWSACVHGPARSFERARLVNVGDGACD